METLDKHAPKKTKIFRENHKPHINKTLRKAIMKRSQLKNEANKTKDPKDILKYKKQRNYVVKLNNQSKQEHFDSLFERAVNCTFPTSIHLGTQGLP